MANLFNNDSKLDGKLDGNATWQRPGKRAGKLHLAKQVAINDRHRCQVF
jgi:hypothetical protein